MQSTQANAFYGSNKLRIRDVSQKRRRGVGTERAVGHLPNRARAAVSSTSSVRSATSLCDKQELFADGRCVSNMPRLYVWLRLIYGVFSGSCIGVDAKLAWVVVRVCACDSACVLGWWDELVWQFVSWRGGGCYLAAYIEVNTLSVS